MEDVRRRQKDCVNRAGAALTPAIAWPKDVAQSAVAVRASVTLSALCQAFLYNPRFPWLSPAIASSHLMSFPGPAHPHRCVVSRSRSRVLAWPLFVCFAFMNRHRARASQARASQLRGHVSASTTSFRCSLVRPHTRGITVHYAVLPCHCRSAIDFEVTCPERHQRNSHASGVLSKQRPNNAWEMKGTHREIYILRTG
jgi:hypothetical protein